MEILTLSTRADRVSGGDVLVEIGNISAKGKHALEVKLNGRDITSAFRPGNRPGGSGVEEA